MTKRRLPLTFENALIQVAAKLGWEEVARICGTKERCVRNWSAPEPSARVPLQAALDLDAAFHAAGGDGTPMLLVYATRLELACLASTPGREALLASASKAALESGEGVAAAIAAARPNASPADFISAEREIEQQIAASQNLLASLRSLRLAAEAGDEQGRAFDSS